MGHMQHMNAEATRGVTCDRLAITYSRHSTSKTWAKLITRASQGRRHSRAAHPTSRSERQCRVTHHIPIRSGTESGRSRRTACTAQSPRPLRSRSGNSRRSCTVRYMLTYLCQLHHVYAPSAVVLVRETSRKSQGTYQWRVWFWCVLVLPA